MARIPVVAGQPQIIAASSADQKTITGQSGTIAYSNTSTSGTLTNGTPVTIDRDTTVSVSSGRGYVFVAEVFGVPDTITEASLPSSVVSHSQGEINVKAAAYGAAADGTTDDTAAIVAALTAARTAGGGTVYLPRGDYLVDGGALLLGAHVTLRGDGYGTRLVHSGTGGTMLKTYNTASDRVTIRDLVLQLDDQPSGYGIDLTNDSLDESGNAGPFPPDNYRDSHHVVQNVLINEAYSDGVYIAEQSRENHLSGVLVRWHTVGGSRGGHGFNIVGTDNYFDHCTVATTQNGKHGFYIANANNLFSVCKAFYCGTQAGNNADGFHVAAARNTFVGCSAQDNGRFGFYFASTSANCTASGIVADSNGVTGIHIGNASSIENISLLGFAAYSRSGGRYTQTKGIEISDVPVGCIIVGTALDNTTDVVFTDTTDEQGSNYILISRTDGATTTSVPVPTGRKYRSTFYYQPEVWGVDSSVALTVDRLHAVPFEVSETRAFDRIGIRVTAGAGTAVLRLGVYTDNNGHPDKLIEEFTSGGTLDASGTGFLEKTIARTFAPGRYWLALVNQGAQVTVVTVTGAGNPAIGRTGTDSANPIGYYQGSVSGALPATWSDIGFGTTACPKILVRAA